jgi:putative tricarboxylic transport membrane protein
MAGYFLRRSGYSVAGIVLGLILGRLGESSFTKAMQMLGYDVFALFSRPIAGLLLAAAILTLLWNVYSEFRRPARAAAA